MVRMTQSMEHFLWTYHKDKFALILMGHVEEFTEEMAQEYTDWLNTEDGRQYLKGGSKYDETHLGNIASAKARAGERKDNEG